MFLGALLPPATRPVIHHAEHDPTQGGTTIHVPQVNHITHKGLDDLEAILQGGEDVVHTINPPPPPPKRHHPPPGFFDPTWDLLPPAAALQCHMSLGEPPSVAIPPQPPQDDLPKSFRQRRPKGSPLSPIVHQAWPDDKTRAAHALPPCTLPPAMASLVVAATAAAAAGLAAGPLGIAVGLKSGALVMVASGGVCGAAYHALANTDPQHHPAAAYLLDDPELAAQPRSCGAEFMHMLGACWPCAGGDDGIAS